MTVDRVRLPNLISIDFALYRFYTGHTSRQQNTKRYPRGNHTRLHRQIDGALLTARHFPGHQCPWL